MIPQPPVDSSPERFPEPVHGFFSVFWGAILVLIDLNINDVDILVDPLGMLLIVFGLHRLNGHLRNASVILSLAYALLIISVFGMVRSPEVTALIREGSFTFTLSKLWMMDLLHLLMLIFFAWFFFGSLGDLARRVGAGGLEKLALKSRRLVLWGVVVLSLGLMTMLVLRSNSLPVLIALLLYGLVVGIIVLRTVWTFHLIREAPLP